MDTTTATPDALAVDDAQMGVDTDDFELDPGVWDIPDPWDEPDGFDDEALWVKRAASVGPAASLALGDPGWTVDVLTNARRANAMLAWIEYREIGVMHTVLTDTGKPEPSARGVRMLDIETQAAARVAMSQGLTQHQGEKWLSEAIAMRDRLPATGRCLRDGIITARQFRLAVSRTELIDGQDWAAQIDSGIAATLRSRGGTWSNKRLIDMIDRIIFRHDPDAVRRRHEKAKQARSVWVVPEADGMATLGATMTAHNTAIAYNAVGALAALACPHDTRTGQARSSDALFALLTATAFECDCGRDDCAAQIPQPDALAAWVADQQNQAIAKGRVLVHVIADQATVDGRDDNPAFMDGHGVISAAHLRDLLARDDVRVRPLNPAGSNSGNGNEAGDGSDAGSGISNTGENGDESCSDDEKASAVVSLPTHLPSDPYRPSTALDTFIRARDGYCTTPGCDQPAWKCDIDHIAEYDHDDPSQGGHTSPDELGAKCRMHHNFKTFAHGWIDDQYRNHNGRLVSEVVSPEGIRFPGPAETNTDLFPSLDHISWHEPDAHPSPARDALDQREAPLDHRDRPRLRNRTKDKHRRRRAERAANRKHRLATEWQHAEQEYHRRREHPRETDGPPPF